MDYGNTAHRMSPNAMSNERSRQARRITLLGALMNCLLGFGKIIGGWFSHSHGLIADGFHSLSDLLTDGMVLIAAHYGSQEADAGHPYGHQRIETAATLIVALILILTGLGIAWDALGELLRHDHTRPQFWALPIAVISILIKEWLYHYTRRVGQRIRSELLVANAWHHRSDALSSIVVCIGLLGSFAGLYYLDALAAFIVAAMIAKMGFAYAWNSVRELIDTATDTKTLLAIENIINRIDGVHRIHQLRSRHMGEDVFIDVHIQVAPRLSVSEGHYIAQHVHHALVNHIENVRDVTVHVDPEDDEQSAPCLHLPSRTTLEHQLLHPWQKDFPAIMFWTLHYLDGRLTIDLVCRDEFDNSSALEQRINADIKACPSINTVRLFTSKAVL